MIKIYAVVLNWNGYSDTIECLKSLGQLSTNNFKFNILVVDNASSDDSVNKLNQFIEGKEGFKLIKNKQNLGFAGGNNVGIRYALNNDADYVLILNNDTITQKNLLNEFVKKADLYPNTAIFSPKIYFMKGFEFHIKRYKKDDLGKIIWYAGGKIDWKNVFGVNVGVDEVDSHQYDSEADIDFATGACMFVRASVLKKTGLFNEKYFMYFEDADLSLRIIKNGWKIKYIPEAIIWHKVARSSGIGSNLNDYFISRNRLLFGLKYAPVRSKAALIKESIKLVLKGRKWQRVGVRDYYMGRFGKGSWNGK